MRIKAKKFLHVGLLSLISTALIGNVGPFEFAKCEWTIYEKQIKNFLAANNIDATDCNRAVLLTIMGETTLQTITDLCQLAQLEGKTFDELLQIFKEAL